VVSRFECSNSYESTFILPEVLELEALHLPALYDVKVFAFISFSEDPLFLLHVDSFDSIREFVLLGFFKLVKHGDLVQETILNAPLVNT